MQYACVISPHRAPARLAIQLHTGDRAQPGARDSDWPQFVWAVLGNGLDGWVPATLFDCGHGSATALQAYDTVELDVDAGEEVLVEREVAQWWWTRNKAGQSGWVPARNLQLQPAT